jgi:hypothetical protein
MADGQLPPRIRRGGYRVAHSAQIAWPGPMNATGGVMSAMKMNGASVTPASIKENAALIRFYH